ncbi:hypothetical protein ACOQFV_11695 [Nocardiopsis changdeensis]|uniref:SPOR domain-containing protein n=1 Tax=Nocardiopsis changdeensis TaxID=2831969 RepID=A0ABX8BUB5_9ACTN|nr:MULTISPECIES: hypothetical protein [Nocardiopsis]QUX24411.1 hypothetical protein KGD84_09130 [Nocardiopsis changdeensis]QYX34802.1 hypothetical protein K1J57_18590 [Nocardiopsis sp. MT53]
MADVQDDGWWYCLRHNTVEHGAGCPNRERLGPYPDEATAARALTIAAERNSDWEDEDEKDGW